MIIEKTLKHYYEIRQNKTENNKWMITIGFIQWLKNTYHAGKFFTFKKYKTISKGFGINIGTFLFSFQVAK